MIRVTVHSDEGMILVEPTGPLEQSDFEKLTREIHSFSKSTGRLPGLVIHTKVFPGWGDFGGFLHHMKFVKEHHREIPRIAIVTDSAMGVVGPGIANYFVSAQVRHFKYDKLDEARQWAQETS